MEFIKKAEQFIKQLQYCLAINPEPMLIKDNGIYNLSLEPNTFFELINKYEIDYPPTHEVKIIELEILMHKENIDPENAVKIIEAFKNEYWTFLSGITIFGPLIDKLKQVLKSINTNITEKEIMIELIDFQNSLIEQRDIIYNKLIDTLHTNKQQHQPIVKQEPPRYIAEEFAITYIFDLYAIGQKVPTNRVEGGYNAKKIKEDASKFPSYNKAPDTFYRAVKRVLEYDLNKLSDLQNISKDWLSAVSNLSNNWAKTRQYLKEKKLIME
jgi:hypothetical protein